MPAKGQGLPPLPTLAVIMLRFSPDGLLASLVFHLAKLSISVRFSAAFSRSASLDGAWRNGYILRHVVFAVEPGSDSYVYSLAEMVSRLH